MLPERRQEIEDAFEAALELEAASRKDWLTNHHGHDLELVHEVLELLTAHDREDGILSQRPSSRIPNSEAEPRRFGPYRVLHELGRGGMGVVYLAERDDGQYRRRVAVKLLRNTPDAEELHRRFLAERQILASLGHPNIAQLLDGGVTDGQLPYIVMEYVDGIAITEYCDRNRLDVPARLRLFQSVCSAVQHAHQNLVIHRDLKPYNILVNQAGQPKLLDFGIAKLVNPGISGTEAPVTRAEFRVLTPEYASPEQIRGDPLTLASDIYALGALLYELLAGRPPHLLAGLAPQATVLAVCEDEPITPAVRVTRTEKLPGTKGSTLEVTPGTVAHARGTTPDRLRRQLSGDLDAIVMMALRKEPARRYASVDRLAEDLQRHLDGEAVLARRGSRWYRTQKLVRRHRVSTATAILTGLTLIVGASVASWQARIAGVERDRAALAHEQSRQVTEFLIGLFQASDPTEALGDLVTARDLLRRGTEHVQQLSSQPDVQAQMLAVLGRVHLSLGEYVEAERLLGRAVTIAHERSGTASASTADAMVRLAAATERLGQLDSAHALVERAALIQSDVGGAGSPETLRTIRELIRLDLRRGELTVAEQRSRATVETATRSLGANHPETINTLAQLGSVLRDRGDYEAAEAVLRETVSRRRTAAGENSAEYRSDLLQLADILYSDRGRAEQSEALYRQVLGLERREPTSGGRELSRALGGIARILEERGDSAGAEALLRQGVDLRRRIFGEEHPQVSAALAHLGGFYRRTGRLAQAESTLQDVAARDKRSLGADHPLYAGTLTALGAVLLERQKLAEADSVLREATEIRVRRLGADHQLVARTMHRRAQVQIRRGNATAAESLLREALEIARAQSTEQSSIVREIKATLESLSPR
jgi:eukaryotic-like serine/threonine-protein kinase